MITIAAPTTTEVVVEYYENGGLARARLYWNYTPPAPPLTPWIQVWGDVHSNTRINAPGGP